MLITLDGVRFRGDASKAMFTVENGALKGWFESPGVRRQDAPRPLGDGSFTAPTYRAGRSIAWSGLIHTTSPGEQRHALEQLAGLCEGRGLSRLSVQHESHATWADVQLAQAPEATVLVYGKLARYDVELWAPDARRYGELRSFTNGSNVYHRGNAPAFPVVRIGTGAASYDITWQGRTFRVSGAPSGGVHRVDMRTGRLTRNGTPVLGAVVRAETSPLPPGARWSYAVSAGSGVTVEVHDTFF